MGQGESNEELTRLQNNLLTLTRTEQQLQQSIKDQALDVTVQDPSVVQMMTKWQRVFQQTFQEYNRVLMRLVQTQDVAAALKLWQSYLTEVQVFLSGSKPDDYNGLSQDQNICELHREILPQYQKIISTKSQMEDQSVVEQINTLTNLHNETLARVLERHKMVRDRIMAWDKYREDQDKLLAWLKEVERERQCMPLQFVYLKQLDKTLDRIQALLDKLQSGESQMEFLQVQLQFLVTDCDEVLAIPIRMEHAAYVKRIANLRAALESWQDFVQKVQQLHQQHVEQSEMITTIFQEIAQALSSAFHAGRLSLSKTKEKLESLQQLRARLAEGKRKMESLSVVTEHLRGLSLSPSDLKALKQQDTLLSQQHDDLEYQLTLLAYRLGEHYGLHGRWENRLNKFLQRIEYTETSMRSYDTMALDDVEEALKRHNCELQAQMSLMKHELEWLQQAGEELIKAAEETEKPQLRRSLDEVNEKWNNLKSGCEDRARRLVDLICTMNSLSHRIDGLRNWLTGIESQLPETFVIEQLTKKCIDKMLEDHERLKTEINAQTTNVGEMLKQCAALLKDSDMLKVCFKMDTIKSEMESVEKRWLAVCERSSERKRKIKMAWKILRELNRQDHETWLIQMEKSLSDLEKNLAISQEKESEMIERVRLMTLNIEEHHKDLKSYEQTLKHLEKSELPPSNLRSLISEAKKIIQRWSDLEKRIKVVNLKLQRRDTLEPTTERLQQTFSELDTANGAASMHIKQLDTRLSEASTSEQRSSLPRRRQQLSEVEEGGHKVLNVRDTEKQITGIKSELGRHEKQEVDEAVQVETLKFEQDTAVQVDTLPRLVRLTSCDDYFIDSECLNECRDALDDLERAVKPNPVFGLGLKTNSRIIVRNSSDNYAYLFTY